MNADLQREMSSLRERNALLVQQAAQSAQAMDAIARGEVDAVAFDASATPVLLRAAQADLRRSAEEFRLLAEAMPQIVWIKRPDGGNVYFNRQWTDYTGLTLEESLGDGWTRPFHPDDRQRAWDGWQHATATSGTYAVECRLRRADGVYCWWLIRGVPVRDASGAIVKWFGTCTDIDALKQAEVKLREDVEERRKLQDQVRQAQKMEAVGRLAGGVAHDFNNLLSVVLCYSELALSSLMPGDPLRADLEEIQKAGLRANGLTRQLLAFSRQQVLEPRVLDLHESVSAMKAMLSRLLGEDVDLTVLSTGPLGQVLVDPSQIEQVVMNLAINARDAMPDGGKLTIETSNVTIDEAQAGRPADVEPGDFVMLAVTDSGVGMTEATRARIFEPFFTTKEQGKGTGLGLATVFGIVRQSGGYLGVYSELGHGTTFKVYVPRTDRTRVAEAPVKDPLSTALDGFETILLVEDEEQVRAVACAILRKHGYNVLETSNGGEAFLVSTDFSARIDLLLTDVVMPRLSGRRLVEQLAPKRPEMKVLFVSGYTDDAIIHHGVLDAGVAFLQKPFTPRALLKKVRDVLDAGVR